MRWLPTRICWRVPSVTATGCPEITADCVGTRSGGVGPTTAVAGAAASNIARPSNAVHSVSWVTLPVRLVRPRHRHFPVIRPKVPSEADQRDHSRSIEFANRWCGHQADSHESEPAGSFVLVRR
jgi:hypothetical protein